MRDVDRSEQIDLKDSRPISRLQVPEWESESARASANGKHDVIHFPDSIRKGSHLFILGDGSLRQAGARRQRRWCDVLIEAKYMAALPDELIRNRPANASRGSEDSHPLFRQIQSHAGGALKSVLPLARQMGETRRRAMGRASVHRRLQASVPLRRTADTAMANRGIETGWSCLNRLACRRYDFLDAFTVFERLVRDPRIIRWKEQRWKAQPAHRPIESTAPRS